jgi:hypothetical protein
MSKRQRVEWDSLCAFAPDLPFLRIAFHPHGLVQNEGVSRIGQFSLDDQTRRKEC